MRKILMILTVFLFSGCASLPGGIKETVSGFDNTKEIVMEPAGVFKSYTESYVLMLGLYKTSKMPTDKAVLVAQLKDASNFSDKDSLQFNIDGEIVTLNSTDLFTDVETKDGGDYVGYYNVSSKRYSVDKDLIEKLINGKKVWVKLNLSKDYVEGEFSRDAIGSVRPAFKKFYEKVWGTNEPEVKK